VAAGVVLALPAMVGAGGVTAAMHAVDGRSAFVTWDGMSLNGSAALGTEGLQITPALLGQAGSAWQVAPVNPSLSFETKFQFWLHASTVHSPTGADGITFTIQDAKQSVGALGGSNGQWGYGARNWGTCTKSPPGIAPSLAVLFNIYEHQCDKSGNYVAILEGGITSHKLALSSPKIQLYNDPSPRWAWITYSATYHNLKVYLGASGTEPQKPVLTFSVDLSKVVPGKTAYVGFTGATGGSDADQDILDWTFDTTNWNFAHHQ